MTRKRRSDEGISLIEIMATLAIASFLILATLSAAIAALKSQNLARNKDIATQYLSGVTERMNATPWYQLGFTTQEQTDADLVRNYNKIPNGSGGYYQIPTASLPPGGSAVSVPLPSNTTPVCTSNAIAISSSSTVTTAPSYSCNRVLPVQVVTIKGTKVAVVTTISWTNTPPSPYTSASSGSKTIRSTAYWGDKWQYQTSVTSVRTSTTSEAIP